MIKIDNNFLGAGIACLGGAGIAAINYAVARFILKKYPEQYAAGQLIRQVLQIGYLLLLYFAGAALPWDRVWLLVGGALGLTLLMPFFTYRLVRMNGAGKEEGSDG